MLTVVASIGIYTCMNYYNEHDPYAADWIRNLIRFGHIPYGFVDERDILDVIPNELVGYNQCHFFAGIGGWAYALKLADWPSDKPIWTGSCPCQPFSAAGKGKGFADERHLWPAFFHLIQQCAPSIVIGEQVASSNVDSWIDLIQLDLEGMGYAFGSVPFPAAGIGSPHIRDRNYWCSIRLDNSDNTRLEGHAGNGGAEEWKGSHRPTSETSISMRLADSNSCRQQQFKSVEEHAGIFYQAYDSPECIGESGNLRASLGGAGPTNGHWRVADWIGCRDGKWRPVEPGTFPLANGIPNRVGRLRGYGNAIVPPQAVEFIKALV